MAKERLLMRKTREILRLRWAQERSVRETATSVGVSTGIVSRTTTRSRDAGLDWEAVEGLSDQALEERLYGRRIPLSADRPEPDPAQLFIELKRPGVTLELLHLEYLQEHPDGLKYTAFCDRYRRWKKRRAVTMRQQHKAGDKVFVDYSGKKPSIVDRKTGKRTDVELFVAVLGASNLTFAIATASQKLPDWIAANIRAYEYFGGVPKVTVPDQLRSAVQTPSRDEPVLQRNYAEMGRHYQTAIIPARPRKPKDKAKVEGAVLIAQRWILARLRNETYFSLGALNERIAGLLEDLNMRPMKTLGGISRRALFERVEQAALQPLPDRRYEYAEWKLSRVNLDYHIEIGRHWYSVPFELIREQVDVRLGRNVVEVFYRGRRVASHRRSSEAYGRTTELKHGPKNHQAWANSDPGYLLGWARDVGDCTHAFMKRILDSNPRREQTWRSGRALRRVGDKYGPDRTEVACERALRFGATSYKAVDRILKTELDRRPHPDDVEEPNTGCDHENIRGPNYYVN